LVRNAAGIESDERLRLQFIDDEVRVTADTKLSANPPKIVTQKPVPIGGIQTAKKKPSGGDTGQGSLF
jgi:exodeoxyribonuclease VII large subunit